MSLTSAEWIISPNSSLKFQDLAELAPTCAQLNIQSLTLFPLYQSIVTHDGKCKTIGPAKIPNHAGGVSGLVKLANEIRQQNMRLRVLDQASPLVFPLSQLRLVLNLSSNRLSEPILIPIFDTQTELSSLSLDFSKSLGFCFRYNKHIVPLSIRSYPPVLQACFTLFRRDLHATPREKDELGELILACEKSIRTNDNPDRIFGMVNHWFSLGRSRSAMPNQLGRTLPKHWLLDLLNQQPYHLVVSNDLKTREVYFTLPAPAPMPALPASLEASTGEQHTWNQLTTKYASIFFSKSFMVIPGLVPGIRASNICSGLDPGNMSRDDHNMVLNHLAETACKPENISLWLSDEPQLTQIFSQASDGLNYQNQVTIWSIEKNTRTGPAYIQPLLTQWLKRASTLGQAFEKHYSPALSLGRAPNIRWWPWTIDSHMRLIALTHSSRQFKAAYELALKSLKRLRIEPLFTNNLLQVLLCCTPAFTRSQATDQLVHYLGEFPNSPKQATLLNCIELVSKLAPHYFNEIAISGAILSLARQTLESVLEPHLVNHENDTFWNLGFGPLITSQTKQVLAELSNCALSGRRLEHLETLSNNWTDGRIKLWTYICGLLARQKQIDAFQSKRVIQLQVTGPLRHQVHVIARSYFGSWLIAVVPRRVYSHGNNLLNIPINEKAFTRTLVILPKEAPKDWVHEFDGRVIGSFNNAFSLSRLWANIPVALLTPNR